MTKAYILPMMLYLIGTSLSGQVAEDWYPWAYAIVVIAVIASLWWSLCGKVVLQPHWRVVQGVVTGVVGIAIWIGLSHLHVEQYVGERLPSWLRSAERVAFDPFTELSGWQVWVFVAVRMIGLAVVVPLAEELFWRGFLLRWLIDPDWEKVPIDRKSVV